MNDDKLNQDFLNQGYIFFELSDGKIKRKQDKIYRQLLDPGFSKVVKVYHDLSAKETMSHGVENIDLVGGDQPACKLKKKNYTYEEFTPLWKSCSKTGDNFSEQKCSSLVTHILVYSESSAE